MSAQHVSMAGIAGWLNYRLEFGEALGSITDRVMFRAAPAAPEQPFANAIVWLLRLADGRPAWRGLSDAAGWYTADGLELGVEYVAVGIDAYRHFKSVAAGPVVAVAS